jgi:hypothetical protein
MKKILIFAAAILLPVLALAQDASDTINLPANFNDSIWSQAQLLFTSFSGYVDMIIGVILALVVIDFIIGALHSKK